MAPHSSYVRAARPDLWTSLLHAHWPSHWPLLTQMQ